MSKKRIVIKSSKNQSVTASEKKYVRAAGEDDFDAAMAEDEEDEGIMDAIDDVADNVEDLQDSIDDMDEDDVDIAINNNIADHYIAECDTCGGIFISAVIESDQQVDSVSGVCPLCRKETEQHLKWIIKDANE